MYRTEFIPLLEFRLRIFKYFKCVNFEFNPKSGRFITCSSPRYISSYRRQSLLSLVYCTLLGLNLCFGPITIFQKLQGFAFFILFLNGLILRWDYNLEYGRSQCQMIHTLVAFEAAIVSDLPHLSATLEKKAVLLLIKFCEILSPMVPMLFFSSFGLLHVPHRSCYLCCQAARMVKLPLQDTWLALGLLTSSSDLQKQFDFIKVYQNLAILEKSFNAFLSEKLIIMVLFGNPVIQIFALFGCISFRQEFPMPGFLVFPLFLVASGMSSIIIITLASRINGFSRDVLTSLERATFNQGTKVKRRELIACNVLKIKFGPNFIDNATPLVLQNFCINQALSLILLKGSGL
ncbi:hypothetical protein Fcan01_22300 [Folsomia candida]|uniref:Uncharacterized protein n=1 Tax=Folsomia candida TaxID=158441 RepID=A0A226DEF2_FOLCA|nr:hypothetical protein Fcan01_22300 [Folsomia candida]